MKKISKLNKTPKRKAFSWVKLGLFIGGLLLVITLLNSQSIISSFVASPTINKITEVDSSTAKTDAEAKAAKELNDAADKVERVKTPKDKAAAMANLLIAGSTYEKIVIDKTAVSITDYNEAKKDVVNNLQTGQDNYIVSDGKGGFTLNDNGASSFLLTNATPIPVAGGSSSGASCPGANSGIGSGQWAQTGNNAKKIGGTEDQRECVQCLNGTWSKEGKICGLNEAKNYITRPDQVVDCASSDKSIDKSNCSGIYNNCWSNGAWFADSSDLGGSSYCSDGKWENKDKYQETKNTQCNEKNPGSKYDFGTKSCTVLATTGSGTFIETEAQKKAREAAEQLARVEKARLDFYNKCGGKTSSVACSLDDCKKGLKPGDDTIKCVKIQGTVDKYGIVGKDFSGYISYTAGTAAARPDSFNTIYKSKDLCEKMNLRPGEYCAPIPGGVSPGNNGYKIVTTESLQTAEDVRKMIDFNFGSTPTQDTTANSPDTVPTNTADPIDQASTEAQGKNAGESCGNGWLTWGCSDKCGGVYTTGEFNLVGKAGTYKQSYCGTAEDLRANKFTNLKGIVKEYKGSIPVNTSNTGLNDGLGSTILTGDSDKSAQTLCYAMKAANNNTGTCVEGEVDVNGKTTFRYIPATPVTASGVPTKGLAAGASCAGGSNSSCESGDCRSIRNESGSRDWYCMKPRTVRDIVNTGAYKNGWGCNPVKPNECESGYCADNLFNNTCEPNPFKKSSAPNDQSLNITPNPGATVPQVAQAGTTPLNTGPLPGNQSGSNTQISAGQPAAVVPGAAKVLAVPTAVTSNINDQYSILMQTGSVGGINININDVPTECKDRSGKKIPCDTSMRTSGCGPATLANYLRLSGKVPSSISDADLINQILYKDELFINCTSNGCSTGSDAILQKLQNNYGVAGAFDNMSSNKVETASELRDFTGFLTYQGQVVDHTVTYAKNLDHNALFECDKGNCYAIDSYTSDGAKPKKCEFGQDNASLTCGDSTYLLGKNEKTINSSLYIIPN